MITSQLLVDRYLHPVNKIALLGKSEFEKETTNPALETRNLTYQEVNFCSNGVSNDLRGVVT